MANALRRPFLHAFRFDGSVSSICRQCQMTVARKFNEIDLRKPEATHTCGGLNLRSMLHPELAPNPGV